MSQSKITLPEPLMDALNELAACLGKSADQSAELAISFFMQSDSASNAIIGKERFDEKAELVAISLNEDDAEAELEYNLRFHPEALEEYEALTEEQQTLVICSLVSRLFSEEEDIQEDQEDQVNEDEDEISFPELLLAETPKSQLMLVHFPFADLVYELSEEAVSIFLIHFPDEDYDEDEEDEDEDDYEDEDYEEDLKEEELEADLEER